jgi:hypothetical protein
VVFGGGRSSQEQGPGLWVLALARTTPLRCSDSIFKQRTASSRGAKRRSNPEPRMRLWIASLPLAMTAERHQPASSRRISRPSFASTLSLLDEEGAGKAGWPHAPGALAQKKIARAREPQVQAVTTGLPCAMVLRLIRTLPGEPFRLPPSPARSLPASLELERQTSGRQDHTTSPSANVPLVNRPISRPPQSAPRS